jgi:hypothetical protein
MDEHRRLLARAVKAEEEVVVLTERLAVAFREIAELRAQIPTKVHQVGSGAARRQHDDGRSRPYWLWPA